MSARNDSIEAAHRVVADRVDQIVVERMNGDVVTQSIQNITAAKSHDAPWARVTRAYAAMRGMEQCPACTGLGMVPPRH